MNHREFVVKRLIQENDERSGLVIVLDDITNCEFHLLTFSEASNVFRSVKRHGNRRNVVIYHAEAHW